jgi:hypothetical protein
VKEHKLEPLARIVGYGGAAQAPEWFTTAPAAAIKSTTAKLGLTTDDIDLYEINEAFAVVTMAVNQLCNLDPQKVNVRGGAVALGHPIGASGARMLVTLLHAMKDQGKSSAASPRSASAAARPWPWSSSASACSRRGRRAGRRAAFLRAHAHAPARHAHQQLRARRAGGRARRARHPHEDEQRDWLAWARGLASQGRLLAIVLTHHHLDHVGGAPSSPASWACRSGLTPPPPSASPRCPSAVARRRRAARPRRREVPQRWTVLHTPGHAPGPRLLPRRERSAWSSSATWWPRSAPSSSSRATATCANTCASSRASPRSTRASPCPPTASPSPHPGRKVPPPCRRHALRGDAEPHPGRKVPPSRSPPLAARRRRAPPWPQGPPLPVAATRCAATPSPTLAARSPLPVATTRCAATPSPTLAARSPLPVATTTSRRAGDAARRRRAPPWPQGPPSRSPPLPRAARATLRSDAEPHPGRKVPPPGRGRYVTGAHRDAAATRETTQLRAPVRDRSICRSMTVVRR